MKKEVKGFVANYKGRMIVIHKVPCYICYYGHIKLSRKTRETIGTLLKITYEKGLSEIDFGS
jgi:hypothetical protein